MKTDEMMVTRRTVVTTRTTVLGRSNEWVEKRGNKEEKESGGFENINQKHGG